MAEASRSLEHRRIRRLVRRTGRGFALLLGLVVPASIATLVLINAHEDRVEDAREAAEAIAAHIYETPRMWRFQVERLSGLLLAEQGRDYPVRLELTSDGALVTEVGPALARPVMSACAPVSLGGETVARVCARSGARGLALALLGVWAVLGCVALLAHRWLAAKPLDLLDRTIRDLEDAAHRAQAADRAKSEFLATMSHEIRTPMNGVLGMTELLSGTELDARQRSFVDTVLSSGRALLVIINDILDVSKIDAGFVELAREPFRLATVAEEPGRMLSLAAQAKGMELLIRVDPSLPRTALGDAARLRQVVTNLAGNAVKFTDAGQVVIDLGRVPGDPALLRVEVRDTGCGIPPDALDAVWGKFTQVDGSHTRRHEGTGLGLAICRGLVEVMGGRIGAESVPGRGSTFWFEVPLVPAEEMEPAVASGPPVDLAGRRVLVVDDNASNRMILAERLEAWRMEEDAVSGGEEALRRLRGAARRGRPYELILLDHHMPGMSGLDVLAELRADSALAGTAVVLLSSMDDDFAQAKGWAHPDVALVKPAGVSALFDAMTDAVAGVGHQAAGLEEAGRPEPDAPRAPPPELGGRSDGAGERVLVVEDNATNLKLATAVLKGMGVAHSTARDGAEAVDAFRRGRPELVLMDVSMPVMNGHEATRAIRRTEAEKGWTPCRVVGLTAHALAADRAACLAAGMDDHLPKPIPIAALKRCVAEALAEPVQVPRPRALG